MKIIPSLVYLFLFYALPHRVAAVGVAKQELTPDKIVEEAKVVSRGEETADLAKRILETQNIELYLAGQGASRDLANELYKGIQTLPESSFLDEIVLRLMRSPWIFDDRIEKNIQGSFPYPSMQNFCIRVIRTKLTGEALEIDDEKSLDRLSRFAARQELADKFEAAIRTLQSSVPTKEETTPPESKNHGGTNTSSVVPMKNSTTLPGSSRASDVPKIWWAAAAVICLGILWWAFRKRNL